MPPRALTIDGRAIGPHHPPYVVAEMSGNHNGSFERARAIIREAAAAGADAVKLQTYTADTMTLDADGPDFRIEGGLWDGQRLYDLYAAAHTPWEWHEDLFRAGREAGLTVFSAPFDVSAVKLLEQLDAPAYKIASFEIVDLPLIEAAAATGKPLIISTGMATRAEIEEAVASAREAGCRQLALLHCVSGYPTPVEDANLRVLPELARLHEVVVGLSDHSVGTAVSVAAIPFGASLVEKHVTVRRADGGPDSAFSLEPSELRELREAVNAAWFALGSSSFERAPSEMNNRWLRRSLYVVKDIAAGERFTADHVRSIRPGYGLPPKRLPEVLGRRASRSVPRGTALDESMLTAEP